MQYRKECSLLCQILILVNYVLEFSLSPKENTYTLSFCYFISLKQYREPTAFLMHLKVFPPLSILLEKAITYKWSKCKGQVETICFSKFFFFLKCPANCWQLVFNGKYQSSRIYTQPFANNEKTSPSVPSNSQEIFCCYSYKSNYRLLSSQWSKLIEKCHITKSCVCVSVCNVV